MFLVSSCSYLYPIHWSQVLSWEWRCRWSSADRYGSAEGAPRGVENRNLLSHPDDLRMEEWKPMSSGWHNNIVVTHPDEIPISDKSSGWHTVYDMSSGWHTAVSKSHPDEIRPGANSSGWLRVQMTLRHPDEIGEYRKSSGWHPTKPISHPDVIPPIVKSSGWDTANS